MSKLIFFIFNIFIILILFIHNLGFFGRYKEGNFCGERFIVKKINIYTFKNDFIILSNLLKKFNVN